MHACIHTYIHTCIYIYIYVFTLPWINTKSPHFIRSSGFKVRVSQGCCSHSPGQSAAVLKGRPGVHSSPSQGWNSAGRKSSFRPHRKGGPAAPPKELHTKPDHAAEIKEEEPPHRGEEHQEKAEEIQWSRSRSRRRRSHHHRRREESEETGGRRSPRNYWTGRGRRPVQESHRSLKERFNREKAPIREQWLPREELDHEGLQLRRMACAALQDGKVIPGNAPTSAVPDERLLWSPGPGSWACAWCLLEWVRCTLSSRLLALKTMNYFVFSVGRQVRSLVYMCAAKAAQVPWPITAHSWKSVAEVDLKRLPLQWFGKQGGWRTCTDELAKLRELQERRMEDHPEGEKNWRRRKRRGGMNGSSLVKRGGRAAKPPKRHEEDLEVGQKALADIYVQIGLDPGLLAGRGSWRRLGALGSLRRRRKRRARPVQGGDRSNCSSSSGISEDVPSSSRFRGDTQELSRREQSGRPGMACSRRLELSGMWASPEIPSILTVLSATGDTAPCGVTG